MKKLSASEIQRLTQISYLDMSDNFIEQSAESLNNIITWVGELANVNTTGVEPMFSVADLLNQHITTWRNDIVNQKATVDDILLNAPDKEDVFIAVPKVIE